MPIDFEKLLRNGSFSNKKSIADNEDVKISMLPKKMIEENKSSSKPTKSKKIKKPQPNLMLKFLEEEKMNVKTIIKNKPPKKVIIEYIENKVKMFEETDSEDD